MTEQTDKNTKLRILEAAIRLFAKKSYSATGLREIVKEAGVSVAMVNYHFGSTPALLKAILKHFFSRMHEIVLNNFTSSDPTELKVRHYFRAIINFFRESPELVRVAMTELPHDTPGIVEFKAEHVRQIVTIFGSSFLPSLPEPVRKNIKLEIVGPAIMGILSSHFIIRPVIKNAFNIEFDDSFYENYADELADLVLYGAFHVKD
ncbi:MAG: TetR/AcrR family transcriptional regulator [Deltaproteobacteria bacterium]|nr:TetR/AcrR family transcriptional regulator [Deltaproteobacteria bacterium]